MGRLFWKFLLAFWLALIAASGIVAVLVALHQQRMHDEEVSEISLATGPRTELALRSAAATLRHGGVAALREWLAEDAHARGGLAVHAFDRDGRELLGRAVPDGALERAREALGPRSGRDTIGRPRGNEVATSGRMRSPARDAERRTRGAVRYDEASGLLLFVPAADAPSRRMRRAAPLPPLAIAGAVLLASLAFSALLAWYLTQPIRHLRNAFGSLADGALETRVAQRMGGRNDELADLGRDFDRMAERLQKLVGSQRRLLHDVSHELRSPLARLQAAIGVARQDPQRIEAMLERIERETMRVNGLVGELLVLARLEAGTPQSALESADLVELVEAIVEDARFEARACGRDVRFEDHGGPVFANVYPELLHRAFENVIRNAVKFTPAGCTVDVLAGTEAIGPFRLTVLDRGPGVPESDLAAIFEPFHRTGNDARMQQGHGLGLAIARRAIEAHGGSISAANRSGGGLVVRIEVPR